MNNAIQPMEEEKVSPKLVTLFGLILIILNMTLLMPKTIESWNDYPPLGQQAAVIVECIIGFAGLNFVLKGTNNA